MKRCSALTAGGGRCQRIVSDASEYCYSHDPSQAAARSRNASRGGKSGGKSRLAPRATEAREIRTELRRMAAEVEAGGLDRGMAAVAGQLLNYSLGALRMELKAEEVEDLIPRIEALEKPAKGRETSRWG